LHLTKRRANILFGQPQQEQTPKSVFVTARAIPSGRLA
jgi:hypothetical protein